MDLAGNYEGVQDSEIKHLKELIELRSRTCEGCKYFYGDSLCDLSVSSMFQIQTVEKDFCCNKWEKKD